MNKIRNIFSSEVPIETPNDAPFGFFDGFQMFSGTGGNVSEVTYFTCLKMLSETIGKLNIDLFQDTEKGAVKIREHDTYKLLRRRPNNYSTPTIFKSQIEYQRNHYGNAYVLINGSKSRITDLHVLDATAVEVLIDNAGLLGKVGKIYYKYTDPNNNKTFVFKEEEIMHFKTAFLKQGLMGCSVQDILYSTLKGAKGSQEYLNNLVEKGFSAKAVLQYSGDLDKKHRRALQKDLEEMGSGCDNSGRVVPLPLGFELKTLDMKLADNQFIDLKKYTALQIASAFGIKPSHINNFDKGATYSSLESQNLSFYVDTLMFILKQYEDEMNYKLLTQSELANGFHFKFNVSSILRVDLKTQAEVVTMYRNNGIYTGNECRQFADLPVHEHGDELLMNGNYIPVQMAGMQYGKGGERDNEEE